MKYYQSLIGDYQIEKTLERSQYSVLCQGKKSTTGQLVLLKFWLTAQIDAEKKRIRVREEVTTLQNIKHPHLLPILEVQVDSQKVFLVSEYASAGSLNERLEQKNEKALSLNEKLQLIEQIGQALQELHAHGITHGNLTPQAVFFDESGQVRLGEVLIRSVLANIPNYQRILDENVPHCFYMAPEQFRGRLDPKTDQYALGCLAYVLLTGRVPFNGSARATLLQKHQRDQPQALTAINSAVPAHIEAAVLKSLAKNPKKRYSNVQAFLEALDVAGKKVLADQSTLKQPIPSALLGETGISGKNWEWEGALPPDMLPTASNPIRTGERKARRSWPVSSPIGQTPPVQPGQPAQKRARHAIIPAALLILALLFITGRWLFFPGGFGSNTSKGSTTSTKSPSILVTQTTTTITQATTTAIATPTPKPTATHTPTPTPHPSVTPKPTVKPVPAQVQVPLASFFNNEGIGSAPGQANFDGSGYSYPASQLPPGGQITLSGVSYRFPGHAPGANDNIIASGQTISLTPGKYRQAFLLIASSWGPVSGALTMRYTNGSTTTTNVTAIDWYQGPPNGLSTTERYDSNGIDPHPVYIYIVPIALNTTHIANALLLPGSQSGPNPNGHIHVFSLTLLH